MKKLLLILTSVLLLTMCQKAPELTISGQQDVSINNEAYTFTITVQSNRPWSAKA